MTTAATYSFDGDYEHLGTSLESLRSRLQSGGEIGRIEPDFGIDVDSLNSQDREILSASLTDVQINSKLWLLDNLFNFVSEDKATILVLGGWCGVLPWLANLTRKGTDATWISVDLDYKVCAVGQRAFRATAPNLVFACLDIYNIDYQQLARQRKLVVINTICEHLHEFTKWRSMLPSGTVTLLQSNNFRGCPDHVNCVDSVQELSHSAGFEEVLFTGSLEMELFTRYMVIGRV